MKLKRLPSMRQKKRYITFRLHSENPLSYNEVKGSLLNSFLNWMGEEGYASSGARLIRNLWNSEKQEGWISCRHTSVDDVKMAMALVHQIGDERVVFRTLRVSGTLKSGKEKLGI